MPILHRQSRVIGEDGKPLPLSPAVVLTQQGPCFQVALSLPPSVAEPLIQQGVTLPEPITGLALIDTGANSTCVDINAAQQLQLPVVDTAMMTSASHAAVQQNIYPLRMEIVGAGIGIETGRAMGAMLEPSGFIALIGRDMLQQCTLYYNGLMGQITLCI